MSCSRIAIIVTSLLIVFGQVAAQEPTAYIGDDREGLDEALGKQPENIGLRMRVLRKMLDEIRISTNPKEQRKLLAGIEKEIESIMALEPDFTYVYRVVALQHFRRGEYEKFIETAKKHEKIGTLDYEMRSFYVKALLRLATDKENPQPERKKEAAAYVGNWFDSGEAPVFGTTMGACSAWLLDKEFRDELMGIFKARYAKNPGNINLVISYAALMHALGRNTEAWKLIHDAEPLGLADFQTGGRHPITRLLHWDCPEEPTPQTYDGFETEQLVAMAKKFPNNGSLNYRLGLNYKIKGLAAEQITKAMQRVIDKELAEDRNADVSEKEEKLVEWKQKSKDFYEKAIAPALKAQEINGNIESISLLLGDAFSKLGRNEDAIKHLKATIDKVPFYFQLRIRLAEVYADEKRWEEAANELVEVCRVTSCRPDSWETKTGSILMVPTVAHEKLIHRILGDKDGRATITRVFEAGAKTHAKNPNLKVFLAMIHYFAGNQTAASRWMLDAEKQGICGEAGFEHAMATKIYSRERW